ncbi:ABC transporter ATP-binding protein [Deinococcus sp.]|uniref:ABC transporter ATP-binding protein n=1 Tax=Deinococcus sp. TaxID=47478 RepID=UPI003CC5A56A
MAQALSLTHISHAYGPDVTLSYPDLHLEGGQELVISGPSGVGKTTLLHFMAGLLRPTGGEVRYGELLVNALSESGRDLFRARNVGYVFQDFHLMPGYSALENVLLGLGLAGIRGAAALTRARESLTALGLAQRLHHSPNQLSTGERQRVALARAVAHRPALLLADEPTAHLDPSRGGEAVALLRRTAGELGATLVVVSHDPAVVNAFEQRLELGKVAAAPLPKQPQGAGRVPA